MPKINAQRLLSDLRTLRDFGASGSGVVRPTYSTIDMQSRRWLCERLTEAGLDARIDGVGNVFGRARHADHAVIIGSHSDTQPTGGWLDGALGVIYGLEVARALAEDATSERLGVDVASWADEESSYLSMIGSRSFCGLLDEAEVAAAVGRNGKRLTEVLREHELDEQPREHLDANRHLGYFEAHIEQGPYLEAQQNRIGVVTGIIGMRDFDIEFSGQQNHAGTTPMSLRRDAGMHLLQFANELCAATAQVAGERTVWTIGKVQFSPGAPSIIPGKASMHWQFRDPDEARVEQLHSLTEAKVAEFNASHTVQAKITTRDDSTRAVTMDERLQRCLADAAQANCPDHWVHMPSGAAHDAQVLAQKVPSAMLFIPSIGGISHSFEEDSHDDDIVLGCQVLADAVANRLLIEG